MELIGESPLKILDLIASKISEYKKLSLIDGYYAKKMTIALRSPEHEVCDDVEMEIESNDQSLRD